jgi:hypothetical protein
MHETSQDDREHTDEIFSQQNDATHPVFLIGRDDQARKPKSHERTTSSNDGTVIDEVASDDREHKPPLSFSNALPRRPESIMDHKMECNLAQRPTWTDDGPQAYLPATFISPKASQYSSSPPSLQMCEAVTYQYPHFVRYSPEDENVDTDRAISDLHSSANDYTVICPREFVDRVHVSRAHSTGGRSDGATSPRSVTLHQPEAIRTWTPAMIKEVPFTFAEVEHMCTAAPEPEPEDDDLVDPADVWYADLATKTANEEIEMEYVSASPEHREHNRLLIADPRLEWLATILTQREIDGDVPHDTPDHCLRNDCVVQVVTVDTSEQSISVGFLVEDKSAEAEAVQELVLVQDASPKPTVETTFAETESPKKSVLEPGTSSNFTLEEAFVKAGTAEQRLPAPEAIAFVPVNDAAPTNAADQRGETTFNMIGQPSVTAVDGTSDFWLSLLILPLVGCFSLGLLSKFLQDRLLSVLLIVVLFICMSLNANKDKNGQVEQQLEDCDCRSSNERQAKPQANTCRNHSSACRALRSRSPRRKSILRSTCD